MTLPCRCGCASMSPHPTASTRYDYAEMTRPKRTSEADRTPHPQSKTIEAGVSRRGLVQALAAGAAVASIATPARAQHAAVLAEATGAEYGRDPARWGSPEVAALFPGFKHLDMRTKGAVIRLRHGG